MLACPCVHIDHIVGCSNVHAVIRRVGSRQRYTAFGFGCRTCCRIVCPEAFRRTGHAVKSVRSECVTTAVRADYMLLHVICVWLCAADAVICHVVHVCACAEPNRVLPSRHVAMVLSNTVWLQPYERCSKFSVVCGRVTNAP
jgi:hypothetical protein